MVLDTVLKLKIKKIIKGITFKAWLIFTIFASVILLLLWFLQQSLITPYYRNAKINSVQTIADTVETMIITNEALMLEPLARDNSLCLLVIDEYQHMTLFNGIGSGCYIVSDRVEEPFDFYAFNEQIKASDSKEASMFVNHGSEMLVFGRSINPNFANYTILINARITPEKAGLVLIQNQFVTLTIVVLLLATLASLIISRKIAKPFIMMTNSARQLAQGNFDVSFDDTNSGYNEFNDLAVSLNYATEKLKKLDEIRMDLLANVSHDIRTPLTMILAYSEMISDFSKDDEKLMLEHLEVIRSEALYLEQLVTDILELSTLQSGNVQLNLTTFNLNSLVEKVLTHFPQNIKVEADKQYEVEADEIKITQVLYNFINNAISHANAQNITIKLEQRSKKVLVQVIDDGVGISARDIDDIWERYNKLNKNFYRDRKTTGLGLSISKGIVEAHHEEVGLISEQSSGSNFYFTLSIKRSFRK